MAYTFSVCFRSSFGNQRVAILSCTADAASGNVSGGGLGFLTAALISPVSMATLVSGFLPRVKINVLEAGTAAVGSVGISGCVTGDAFYLHLFGRS